MNINNEDIDLGLALGSLNYRVLTKLDDSSGAGVNANSRVDMTFAASDPLSELVWSPHKGLSLKCADSTIANKKPFRLWNVGPSNTVVSPSQSIRSRGNEDEKATEDKDVLALSQTAPDGDIKFSGKSTSAGTSKNGLVAEGDGHHARAERKDVEEVESIVDAGLKEECLEDTGKEICSPRNVQIANNPENSMKNQGEDMLSHKNRHEELDMSKMSKIVEKTSNQNINIVNVGEDMGVFVAVCSQSHAAGDVSSSAPNLQPLQESENETTSSAGEVNKNELKILNSISVCPLEKLESSSENDICHLVSRDGHTLSEERELRGNSLPVESTPTDSRIRLYREKGKEKALSDGDANRRLLDDREESHGTIGSCKSSKLFSKGIKRQNCDEELIVEGKRVRKQIEGTSALTSIVRHDSSFMNWISNMVNGTPQSNREGCPSLALTLANSGDVCERNRTHYLARKNRGFQNIFKSLYCQKMKQPEAAELKEKHRVGETEEAGKAALEDSPPSYHRGNGNSSKQIVISNEGIDRPMWTNVVGQSSKPCENACQMSQAGKRASHAVTCRTKDWESSSDSLCRLANNGAENASLSLQQEGQEVSNMPNKIHPPSLWITRFSTKTLILDDCSPIKQEALQQSSDCFGLNPESQIDTIPPIKHKGSRARDVSVEEQVESQVKEIQSISRNVETSVDMKSMHKLNHILPSQKFNLEAISSVFARRLDALRHISPSEKIYPSICTLCYFCGTSGHDLRECPEVTEKELEDLLRKISSYEKVGVSRCLCIRCFQLDHWASTCPVKFSGKHWKLEKSSAFVNQYNSNDMQLGNGNEKPACFLGTGEENQFARQLHGNSLTCKHTWTAKDFVGEMISTSKKLEATPSNLDSALKESPSISLCKFISAHDTDAPTEMIHAINKLRLSRSDILRWMDFNISLSYLNGFFLRLRLGKCEAGLRGTGYYVACITGAQGENIGSSSRSSIFVDVGGVKSVVGTQYVSNHDFLEDEIKVWWYRILKIGGRLPSLDELNLKVEERKNMGF